MLGNIIKTAIDVKDKLSSPADPPAEQQEVLMKLLKTARDTAFGKYHEFNSILNSKDPIKTFQVKVPVTDYHELHDKWWHKTINGAPDITWPGSPKYFALSSGTTGKNSKRIPVTDEMLDTIRTAGVKQVSCLANFNLPPDFFEKEILMLGSSTDLKSRDGFLEGEISGISASNIPFWFKGYYKPGEEISSIDNWDERIASICAAAPDWDIGALSGIPAWIELMLKAIIKHHNLDTIHDLWPSLQVYTTGGVAFEPYRNSFEKLLKHPLIYIDTYLASEGFLALQTRPQTSAMQLITDNGIFFEFVPFKDEYINEDGAIKPGSPTLTIAEIEENTDYALLISTVAGAWRYLIGDTIRFTDKSRMEIKITGRTKHFLNVVGSQLSVTKMNDAMKALEEKYTIAIPEFTVAAVKKGGDYIHCWYLGCDDNTQAITDASQALDKYLKEANKNYRVARDKALTGIEVHFIPTDSFYAWNNHKKKKGGQVKMPRVMKEEDFTEFVNFIKTRT